MNLNFKTDEEFYAARETFYAKHPEAPKAQSIECLSLIMKREFAEQILAGTKKLEYRAYSPFYISRLIDKKVAKYIQDKIDDDEVVTFCNDIRQVEKIHFHDYNNSWFLDVECELNDAFSLRKEDVEYIQREFGAHEWDNDLENYEKAGVPENERPYFFYLVCGKVIDTNLGAKKNTCEDISKNFNGGVILSNLEKKSNLKKKEELEILKLKVNKETFQDVVNHNINFYSEDITPKNQSKFFIMNENNTVKEINGAPSIRSYDAIQFINKDNSYMCQIIDVNIVFWDDDYNLISYLELNEEERTDIDYTDCLITYTLGEEIK